jgi:hypothetical protein
MLEFTSSHTIFGDGVIQFDEHGEFRIYCEQVVVDRLVSAGRGFVGRSP